jgi:(2Fe-2S) ferredoxin
VSDRAPDGGTTCRVSVCRDCCCGSRRKHPDVDHDLLLDRLTAATGGHAEVVVSGCLLACERSNVVVVSPSRRGRGAGGRPTWFQQVFSTDDVDTIAAWVCAGGPGVAPMSDILELMQTAPARPVAAGLT